MSSKTAQDCALLVVIVHVTRVVTITASGPISHYVPQMPRSKELSEVLRERVAVQNDVEGFKRQGEYKLYQPCVRDNIQL